MLKDFILTIALLCPNENSVQVVEVLDVHPMSFEECNAKMEDDKFRKQYQKEKGDCELDLLCIRTYWKDCPDD